jgi:cytochrome c peroxidase
MHTLRTAILGAGGIASPSPGNAVRGLWQHAPYFHDGTAATLEDVVDHYDAQFVLGLTDEEHADLVEILKSL